MVEELRLGRYTLHAEIAAGGMATVYLGRLNGVVGFGRTVAIKRLHPHLAKDPEFVTMFLDEARLAARIQHPNVVPTLDVIATDGELFLVLEYVKGESVSALVRASIKAGKIVPMPVVASVIAGSLNGLEAAHDATDERGEPLHIVHRDVSPQNIIVGADGVARVLDFGVAKAERRLSTTREGQLKGKVQYMAPEQLAGDATRQTDIYAIGVVMWELLTRRKLFNADSEVEIMSQVRKGALEPPSKHNPHVPTEVDAIVMKALAVDPAQRFGTAREMAQAIDAALDTASSMRVSEWMKELVGPALLAKEKLIADIESGVSKVSAPQLLDSLKPPPMSGPLPAGSVAAPPSTMRRFLVLGVAAACGAGICLAAASALGVFSQPQTATAAESTSPQSSAAPITPLTSSSTLPSSATAPPSSVAGPTKRPPPPVVPLKKPPAGSASAPPSDDIIPLFDSR